MAQKPSVATPINRNHPLADQLVAAYLAAEGGGQLLFDSAAPSYAKSASLVNSPTRVVGTSGTAVRFNGTNQYARTPVFSFRGANKLTFVLRANLTPQATTRAVAETTSNYNSFPETVGFFLDTTNLALSIRGAGGTYIVKNYALPTTGWHTYVALFDHSFAAGTVKLWIDGVQQTETSFPNTSAGAASTFKDDFINLMARGTGTISQPGDISHLLVYRRELTLTEVRQLYTDPYAMFSRDETPGKTVTTAVTLTGNILLDAVTLSAAISNAVGAQLTKTLDTTTLSAAANPTPAGSLNVALTPVAMSSASTSTVSATCNVTLSGASLSAAITSSINLSAGIALATTTLLSTLFVGGSLPPLFLSVNIRLDDVQLNCLTGAIRPFTMGPPADEPFLFEFCRIIRANRRH